MKKSPFRILIADQQPLTRIGLRQLLQNSSIFCYVGEVAAEDKMITALRVPLGESDQQKSTRSFAI